MATIFWLLGILVGGTLFAWGVGESVGPAVVAGALIVTISMIYGAKGRTAYTTRDGH